MGYPDPAYLAVGATLWSQPAVLLSFPPCGPTDDGQVTNSVAVCYTVLATNGLDRTWRDFGRGQPGRKGVARMWKEGGRGGVCRRVQASNSTVPAISS